MTSPTSEVYQSNYNIPWVNKNDIIDTVWYPRMFKRYGEGLTALDWFEAAGQTMDISNEEIKHLERLSPLKTIITAADIAVGAAGADITVVIAAASMDDNDLHPARVGFSIIVPAAYQIDAIKKSREYRIQSFATTVTDDDTLTCSPLADDSRIGTQLDSGIELMIGPSSYAEGSTQPVGTTEDYATRTHKSRLYKDAIGMEGGKIARAYEKVVELNGQKKLLNEAILRADFLLDNQIDLGFCFSEENDNSVQEATYFGSGNQDVKTGKGIYTWADELAQSKDYADLFEISDFYDNKLDFESQGVTDGEVVGLMGTAAATNFHRTCSDYIKSFSGGSDLLDKVKKRLGITVQTLELDGYVYHMKKMASLANPAQLGLNISDAYTYEYPASILFIPQQVITVNGFTGKGDISINNVIAGNVNFNGENRSRVLKRKQGMNGVFETVDVATPYDGFYFYWLAQKMSICAGVNQWIYWRQAK